VSPYYTYRAGGSKNNYYIGKVMPCGSHSKGVGGAHEAQSNHSYNNNYIELLAKDDIVHS
jgi:hypothetical protein